MKRIIIVVSILAILYALVEADKLPIKDRSQIIPYVYKATPAAAISSETRVVGGDKATPNSFPYQAALFNFTTHTFLCGAALISRTFVITAAHCLQLNVTSVEVVLGAHNITELENTQRFVTAEFKVHEKYDDDWLLNDIALIKLPSTAVLNQYVEPVILPNKSDISNTYVGSTAILTGWGRDSNLSNKTSDVLRFVKLPIIENNVCFYSYPAHVQETNICTGGSGGKGGCTWDSGGPLVVDGKQVGIVSFGKPNDCEGGYPTSFTRVTSYLDWIEENSGVIIT